MLLKTTEDAATSTPTVKPWQLQMAQNAIFGSVCGRISALMGVSGLPLTMSYLTMFAPNLPHHVVQGMAMVSVVPSVLFQPIFR